MKYLNRVVNFVSHDIWVVDNHNDKSRWLKLLLKQIKVFIVTFKNYGKHQIGVSSAALSFYTLISLVPVLALVFAISKGFGIEDRIVDYIREEMSAYDAVVQQLTLFAKAYLENSQVGIFAGVGFVILFWSVLMVFGSIESSFNKIWEVKRERTLSRKISDYLSILIFTPILFVIYKSLASFLSDKFTDLFFIDYIINLLPLIFLLLILTLLYYVLPNTRVKFSAAFYASVVSGIGYMIFESLYYYFQTMISSYDIVYGSFAALPLFLIWISISWQIVLFGGELSFAYQNLAKYEYEMQAAGISFRSRRKLTILVMGVIVKNFMSQHEPMTSEQIAEKLDIAVSGVRDVLDDLEHASLVLAVESARSKSFRYTPSCDPSSMSVWSVIDRVERAGNNDLGGDKKAFKPVDNLFQGISDAIIDSKINILIKDI